MALVHWRVAAEKHQVEVKRKTDEEWFTGIFRHLPAPAIKSQGFEWRTLKRTITKQEFLNYWRSPLDVIALRFGAKTRYLVADVDRGSRFHPENDRESFSRLLEALEESGLCAPIVYRSSESGGLHLVYPLPEERGSFLLAIAVEMILLNAGFRVRGGHLEIFPNRRQWVEHGRKFPKGIKSHELDGSDYNAVRVPLQAGCTLLDATTLEPLDDSSLSNFRKIWEWSEAKQDIETLDELIQFYSDWKNWPKRQWQIAGNVPPVDSDDALETLGYVENDYRKGQQRLQVMLGQYEALKARGWRSRGETQPIIKHLTRLTRIFHRTTDAHDLAEKVQAIAESMPGFREFSKHVHDISRVCLAWSKAAIKKGYHWHGENLQAASPKENKNELRYQRALTRIMNNLKGFQKQGHSWPTKTALVHQLAKAARCSMSTIFKHWEAIKELAQKLIQKKDTGDSQEKITHLKTHSVSKVSCPPSVPSGQKKEARSLSFSPAFFSDWNPFNFDGPPPKPKPATATEFLELTETLPTPTEQPDYESIETYMQQVFQLLQATAYSSDFDSLVAIAGEIRRLTPGAMIQVRDWLGTLPTAPERDRPKPEPVASDDELAALKKLKRAVAFKKRVKSGGWSYVH